MNRKSLSKKLRFEVFKRDGFTCQYCGATPPGFLYFCKVCWNKVRDADA